MQNNPELSCKALFALCFGFIFTGNMVAAQGNNAEIASPSKIEKLLMCNECEDLLLSPQFMVDVKVNCARADDDWNFKALNISPVAVTTYNNRK